MSNVSGPTDASTSASFNEQACYESVDTLCERVQKAITNKDYDEGIDILLFLDQGKCAGTVRLQKFQIVKDLSQQSFAVVQKLLNTPFQTFTIQLAKNQLTYKSKVDEVTASFLIDSTTTKEGQALLQEGLDLFKKEELVRFKTTLEKILELHQQYCISGQDIASFIEACFSENVVVARQFLSLLNQFLEVDFQGMTLDIRTYDHKMINKNPQYLFKNFDDALHVIKMSDPSKQLELYRKLQKIHKDKKEQIAEKISHLPKL